MKSAIVFFISALSAVLVLALERVLGIEWDFHPDSVTYATLADETVQGILSQNYLLIFNNGYYFWASILGMSVTLMTVANIIFFSITNIFLVDFHTKHSPKQKYSIYTALAFAILMFNPYRIHLATTILKDTLIIMLVVFLVYSDKYYSYMQIPILIVMRVASPLYFFTKLSKKNLVRFLIIGIAVSVVLSSFISDRLLEFNSADMQLRDFDKIPNFRDLGLIGTFLRASIWPILAITGGFALLSPALAFFPVALGSMFNQIYCRLVLGRFSFPLAVAVPMAIFASLVTGYTAYIRYIYPLLVVLPMVAVRDLSGPSPKGSS